MVQEVKRRGGGGRGGVNGKTSVTYFDQNETIKTHRKGRGTTHTAHNH